MNEWCRAASPSVNMIVADARGLYAQVFNDFGPKFTVVDTTGEAPITAMIASITSETSAVVTTLDVARHGLEDGDVVTFLQYAQVAMLRGLRKSWEFPLLYSFNLNMTLHWKS